MLYLKKILCAALAAMMILAGTSCDVLTEPTPSESTTEQIPDETVSDDRNPDETEPAEITPAETDSEETTEEVTTEEVTTEEVTTEEVTTEEVTTEEVTTEEVTTEEVTTEEVTTDAETAEESIPAETETEREEIIEDIYSKGLEYVSNGDGTCTVKGMGTCTDTEIIIPAMYNGERVTRIGENAFSNRSTITMVYIPDSVKTINSLAFYGNKMLTSYEVDEDSQAFASIDGVLYSKDRRTLVRFPDGKNQIQIPDGVTVIAEGAFKYHKSLLAIDIPDSVTTIGSYAFDGCVNLTSVTLGDSLKEIGFCAFKGCSSLTDIVLPESVIIINQMAFQGCTGLPSMSIPDGVWGVFSNSFAGCDHLIEKENGVHYVDTWVVGCDKEATEIVIREGTRGIAYWAFQNRTGLTSVVIPEGVTYIHQEAFRDCAGLTSVFIPKSVIEINDTAFMGCSSLSEIIVDAENPRYHSTANCLIETENKFLLIGCKNSTIPTDGSVMYIGQMAFRCCTGLTSFYIPDNIEEIPYRGFWECTGLTSIVISDSVTRIGEKAFYKCSSLTDIYFTGTESEWNAITKGTDWDSGTPSYTVHFNYVP